MKKLSTISLFIFGVVVTAILVAGLVFYQNNKNNQVSNNQTGILVQDTVNQLTSSGKSLVLDMTEIKKHNNQSDCWMLISGKVYNITSFFGSHPGGDGTMAATCGTDSTAAYNTKDPYASNNIKGKGHSSNAKNLLSEYYLGDLGQTIGSQATFKPNVITPTLNTQTNNSSTKNQTPIISVATSTASSTGNITLSMNEIAKHNKSSDCWYLISGKVYNITSFFGSHPGGDSAMTPSCGKDATAAYQTKDPYAKSSNGSSAHSSNAVNLLANYYIGNLNQTIGQQKITDVNTITVPNTNNDDNEWDD